MRLTADETRTYLRFAELTLPRHTSYPTVPHWRGDWTARDLREQLATMAAGPVGLYVHVPFCRQLCAYCGCTREIVPDAVRAAHDPAEDFLAGLESEARALARELGKRVLAEVHLGGGTPTFLTPAQMARAFAAFAAPFALDRDVEMACEVDPRVTTVEHLRTLRGLGFRRLSVGVQDFAPEVQAAIGRRQSVEEVRRVVDAARELGFASVNFDLIYGLPHQTEASLAATLATVIALAPDRVAFFRLAVLPDLFRWQRQLRPADLPTGLASLRLMELARETFGGAGYAFVGLDHFARPHDALAQAAARGALKRDFQGMSVARSLPTLALGPSGISQSDRFFSQGDKTTKAWRAAVEADGLSARRGLVLSADDVRRRDVLQALYANGTVDLGDGFAGERAALATLAQDGLVELEGDRVTLTPRLGRLLVRVVASVFDRYLPADAWRRGLGAGRASATG
jgi:oxygen-independent coproporphyrinogen-3 oxidase